ncbi:NAD(P)H-binding protein [Furfurilactobacillus cerevisiae]|uniref:NAD(P)H-binding protein n=1 Tax=Furfurilactobacillus rossiae TaxID=231049 RepID=UPI003B9837C5
MILGGSGKLGQAVYKQLAPFSDVTLRLFDRGKSSHNDTPLAEHIIGDATSVDDLKRALQGIDVVFSTLGPFHVETFAKPLTEAMNATGVKRLFWTTQFQIAAPTVTKENLVLAQTFGFDEKTERDYVANQTLGAKIIEAGHLDSTLLLCHFFDYNDAVQRVIVEPAAPKVSGGPISIGSMAIVIADMLRHEERYRQPQLMISALK